MRGAQGSKFTHSRLVPTGRFARSFLARGSASDAAVTTRKCKREGSAAFLTAELMTTKVGSNPSSPDASATTSGVAPPPALPGSRWFKQGRFEIAGALRIGARRRDGPSQAGPR